MKQTTKRFLSLLLGMAFLVGSLIIFFDLVRPAYDDAQGIKAQQYSLSRFLDSESATIKQVKDLIGNYESQQSQEVQQNVSLALPKSEDLAGAVAQLYGLAQNNSLDLQTISISVSLAAPSSGGGGATPAAGGSASFAIQKPIGNISFQLKLGGTYEALKVFISQLETNIRIFDVKSISIQPVSVFGKSVQDLYNYDVSVTAYYQGK